ncbi:hypothetical protein GQ53DRAFT_812107 [Thozetella sp. PMI_491]|nr:hypothetical protein GQ53DRAFT_812107 [Thozetella sp. PMI_491]
MTDASLCLDGQSLDQILARLELELAAHNSAPRKPVVFHWPAAEIDALFLRLEALPARHTDYDYRSETVHIDMTGESEMHYLVQSGLRALMETAIAAFRVTIDDPEVCRRMACVRERGTADIKQPGAFIYQADVAFREFTESTQYAEEKATKYITDTHGQIGAVLLVDLGFPHAKQATIGLMVADSSLARWVQRGDVFTTRIWMNSPMATLVYTSRTFSVATIRSPLSSAAPRARNAQLACHDSQIVLTYEQLRSIFLDTRELHSIDAQEGGEGRDVIELEA